MSKIGKINISIPDKVKVALAGSILNIEGPLGKSALNIDLDSDAAEFTETFKFKDKSKPTRKQTHHLTIPPIKDMLSLIKNAGFVYKRKEDLVICGYEYQYLYFFTKK